MPVVVTIAAGVGLDSADACASTRERRRTLVSSARARVSDAGNGLQVPVTGGGARPLSEVGRNHFLLGNKTFGIEGAAIVDRELRVRAPSAPTGRCRDRGDLLE